MSNYRKIAVLGGDRRQTSVADFFAGHGYEVAVWGLPPDAKASSVEVAGGWREAVCDADVLVLPLPASPDNRYLNMPLVQEENVPPPLLLDVLRETPSHTLVAGGRLSVKHKEMLERLGRPFFDYFESEELQQKNAIPTAEGAVEVLMHEVPQTVKGLSVAVTGYGRVSRALSSLLVAMGARVTVMARKSSNLLSAMAMGCDTQMLGEDGALLRLGDRFAVIFNTVPCCLFDEEVLRGLSHETVIVDLASAPGGVDVNAAKALGIRAIWALSLPGKYAPVTAGQIIGETVLSYMENREKEGAM